MESHDQSKEVYQEGTMPEIFQLVGALDKKLSQFQASTLRETNLTPPQFYVLKLLVEKERLPFKDLATALSCTRATVTGVIDTMEKKKLVARVPNSDDRRSMWVQITEKGRSLLQSTPALGGAVCDCCDMLEPEETQELSRLLKKMLEKLNF